MRFKYEEDEYFFKDLFNTSNKETYTFDHFFDFRNPHVKRKAFNRMKKKLYNDMIELYGERCMLSYDNICDPESGFVLDHIIPISTNTLNKVLRDMKAQPGKKVPSESYGSNHMDNLAIVCNRCNGHKKNRLLSKKDFHRVLSSKSS
jgi:5-methylcytosine-specific restriction endonuclease McrA